MCSIVCDSAAKKIGFKKDCVFKCILCLSIGGAPQESNFTELEKAFAEARRRSLAQGAKPPTAKKEPAPAADKPAAAAGGAAGKAVASKAVASKAVKPKPAEAASKVTVRNQAHASTSAPSIVAHLFMLVYYK